MIPIENLYYIYCYAWGRFPEANTIGTGSELCPNLQSLLAKVLVLSVRKILRRGIDSSYVLHRDRIKTVRGKISVTDTIAVRSSDRSSVVCEFDELSSNVLHNQILKSTIVLLSRSTSISVKLRHELKTVAQSLSHVDVVRLNAASFSQVKLNRNNAYYSLALHVCRLAFDALIPSQSGQGSSFKDITQDERQMALVFEDFVRNFLRERHTGYSVQPLQMDWFATGEANTGSPQLPSLRTDIFLRSAHRQIIIDTKYYKEALQQRFDSQTVRSGHLFQLFSYLKNAVATGRSTSAVEGLLLYPSAKEKIHGEYHLHGHRVQIATIDLDQSWSGIENDLLEIVDR